MNYIEIKISIDPVYAEILIAELHELGYDSFAETAEGIDAYIVENLFKEEELKSILAKYTNNSKTSYSFKALENKNWNEEWEKNFQPVIVENKCIIKASFHQIKERFPYEIIINPKMSFGTGHHETTYMMIQNQLNIDHRNKKVIDAGCGTGILAIMASKLGAENVLAFDIEDWAFENLEENIKLNNCQNIQAALGDIIKVPKTFKAYDIILANINKNVLLSEIKKYSALLVEKGKLVLSGFYKNDVADIDKMCISNNLKQIAQLERNNWASSVYERI